MPTVLDELIVQTKVDLSGLQSGIREAERMAAQARGRLAEELAATTFQINVSDAVSQIRGLSEATIQLHAALTLLRAQLAQPFTVSIDTSQLRRAARDIADMQAAMANVGAPASARAATTSGATPSAGATSAIVVRGSGASTPIIVSGPVMVTGPAISGGGFGGMIPPVGGTRIALPSPGGGSFINMAPNAAGMWTPPRRSKKAWTWKSSSTRT